MPGMDGFETAAQIKQRGRTPNVPIIFLTAAGAEPELAFRGYAAGAVDYISKPFDPWVLRAKVSVFVDLYLKERQLRAVSDLPSRLSAIEEAAAGLAALPAALASGALTDATLADGLARLDGAIASLRSTLGGLGGRGRPRGRAPRAGPAPGRRGCRAGGLPAGLGVLADDPRGHARHHAAVGDVAADHRARPRPPRCGRCWRRAGRSPPRRATSPRRC